MPRITRVYTGKGDDGTTALIGGQRVPKDALRVQAYGSVDELNSQIGLALSLGLADALTSALKTIQNDLFHLGSDLATRADDRERIPIPQIEGRHVDALEELIDQLSAALGPLENFILPGGSSGAAALHVARAVCRRAERDAVALSRVESIGAYVLKYLNRLSDALFVMARYENQVRGVSDVYWDSHA
ncbi:MAG TPA: cob(I)yrinic acid a,c-diamide adenosyltransferase [Anaerolineae bacterium]|nr:cob(I)yrinic acid a,c-diamide adenosyltransferase [Anaerolineae bacterium]